MAATHAHAGPAPDPIRPMPPVTEIGAVAMACIASAVVVTAAYLPKKAPMAVPIALGCAAGVLIVACFALLSRVEGFAWWRFRQVAGYAFLAYAVIGGMIEYAFVYDHTRGTQLVILTLMLALFMLNVPVLIAFTVARYQRADV
jgi:hypothetical protein